jgi:hypothetical protein
LQALAEAVKASSDLGPDLLNLVVIPDAGEDYLEQYDSESELVSRLKELSNEEHTRVRIFIGKQCLLTEPPRTLITPNGRFPLEPVVEPAIDPSGYLGKYPVKPVTSSAAADLADEEEEDDEDDDDFDDEEDEDDE